MLPFVVARPERDGRVSVDTPNVLGNLLLDVFDETESAKMRTRQRKNALGEHTKRAKIQ